jgi:hypothetical protein
MSADHGDPFPVVEERRLPAVVDSRPSSVKPTRVGGLLLRTRAVRRREPDELPQRPPGTQLVFDVDGTYRLFPDQGRLTGTEQYVLDALAVACVDLRPRLIIIPIELGSATSMADFPVNIGFRCRVTDPAAVAQDGLTDLRPVLTSYLYQDRRLGSLTADLVPARYNEARRRIQAHVTAYCQVSPPICTGLEILLATVEVLPAE